MTQYALSRARRVVLGCGYRALRWRVPSASAPDPHTIAMGRACMLHASVAACAPRTPSAQDCTCARPDRAHPRPEVCTTLLRRPEVCRPEGAGGGDAAEGRRRHTTTGGAMRSLRSQACTAHDDARRSGRLRSGRRSRERRSLDGGARHDLVAENVERVARRRVWQDVERIGGRLGVLCSELACLAHGAAAL